MEEREVDARDAELQRRVSMGERAPFEELYRLYSPPAYGLALRVTGHDLLAQEVVHDAFMALWILPVAASAPSSSPWSTTAPSTRCAGRTASDADPPE
jgi:DNA-directed RNA polymerase specialized sigma24 family protein